MGGKYMLAGTVGVTGVGEDASLLQEEKIVQNKTTTNKYLIMEVEYFRLKSNAEV
jgi:hypothetical protein